MAPLGGVAILTPTEYEIANRDAISYCDCQDVNSIIFSLFDIKNIRLSLYIYLYVDWNFKAEF